MHIKYMYKIHSLIKMRKKSVFSFSILMQWNPKVCWIHLFGSYIACTSSFVTRLWHKHSQNHLPSSLWWSQRTQTPLTSSFLFLPLFCLPSPPQWSDVPCSLFLLFPSFPHLFFLWAERGKERWIYGVLEIWSAFCAGIGSGSFSGLYPATVTFPGACVLSRGMWTGTAYVLTQKHKNRKAEMTALSHRNITQAAVSPHTEEVENVSACWNES